MSRTQKRKAKRKRQKEEAAATAAAVAVSVAVNDYENGISASTKSHANNNNNSKYATALLAKAFREKKWRECETAIIAMHARGRMPTVQQVNKLLSMYEKNGMTEEAMFVFNAMRRRNKTNNNENENNDSDTKINVPRENLGNSSAAARACSGVVPSVVTYSIIVRSLGNIGDTARAFEVFEEARNPATGLRIDNVLFNAAINAIRISPNPASFISRAEEVVQDCQCFADVVTMNSMLGCYDKLAMGRKACIFLLNVGMGVGVGGKRMLNSVSWTHVISACAKAGMCDNALQMLALWKRRSTSALVPDRNIHIYNAALSACERVGRWRDALKILDDMQKRGPEPDEVSLRSVIFCLLGASPGLPRVQRAWMLFKKCETGGFANVSTSAISYRVLIRGLDFCRSISRLDAYRLLISAEHSITCDDNDINDNDDIDDDEGVRMVMVKQMPAFRVEEQSHEDNLKTVSVSDNDDVIDQVEAVSRGEELKNKFRVVYHEAGFARMPKNYQDLDVFTSIAGSIPVLSSEGIERQKKACVMKRYNVAGVDGALVLAGVLTQTECNNMIEAAESVGFRPDEPVRLSVGGESSSFSSSSSGHMDGSLAASTITTTTATTTGIDSMEWLVDNALYDTIWERVRDHLPQTLGGCKIAGINQRFRLFRYGMGGVYRPHIDGSWPGSGLVDGKYAKDVFGDRISKMTFLIYLNDDFGGGSTTFYIPKPSEKALEAYSVVPTVGAILCFGHGDDKSSPVHEGELVVEGRKYVARTDVLYYI